MLSGPHWLKIQRAGKEAFAVGHLVPARDGWALYSLVSPVDREKRSAPKLLDVAIVDFLNEHHPEVRRVIVHFRGTGDTYHIDMATLVGLCDQTAFKRGKPGAEFLVVPYSHWTRRPVREPFSGPPVPPSNEIIVTPKDRPKDRPKSGASQVPEQEHADISY